MSELKPCPFCGGEAVIKQYRADGIEIKCSSCHSGRQQRWLHQGRDWLEAKMIEQWNTRAVLAQEAGKCEAVAFVHDCGWTEWYDMKALKPGDRLFLHPASPPAPVSVVLPKRLAPEHWMAHGWNACLDKVKELNQ